MIKPEQITDEMVNKIEAAFKSIIFPWPSPLPKIVIAAAANVVLRHMGIDADLGAPYKYSFDKKYGIGRRT